MNFTELQLLKIYEISKSIEIYEKFQSINRWKHLTIKSNNPHQIAHPENAKFQSEEIPSRILGRLHLVQDCGGADQQQASCVRGNHAGADW